MSTAEQWKEFADGFYEVSNLGRIRRAKPGRNARVGRILKTCPNSVGYPQVDITYSGNRKTRAVHRIVAEAFLGPCPVGMQVNHIDGDKTNNNVSNLEYVTGIENAHHAMRTGLRPKVIPQAAVDRVRFLRSKGMMYRDIAKETGVSKEYCRKLAANECRTKPL